MDFDDDIAVVGTGCHFPGGEGLDHFWKVLVEGRNCAVLIPDHRFNTSVWIDPDKSAPGKTQTTKAALIDGLNDFDHKFFGITEAEANIMDPQQKLLLHCTYRALEDAGIPMEKASGTRTGVYIGLMNRDYETMLNNSPSTISHYNATGTAMSIAANRISYTFNFTGPSFAIDSACSSSLVALHTACQAIKQGDCDMAVCGGVNCIIEPRVFVALSKAKMISPDGTSKPFSSRGDGYGRGEGCGIVLLKPLKKALQDIDHVWGIISKTAVNQDGHTVSPITKPSMVQQEQLLRRIYSSETDLSSVQYIEAHGTGTPVGDPVEAGSISNVIAKSRHPGSAPLYMGSVKSNIGHTESAAGVAGLIKVLLMMKHETIVPSVFYSEDSSSIDGNALNLKIPTKAEKWQRVGSAVRVAGLNNFGFGGTNAHAIIKEYVQTQVSSIANLCSKGLFVLSASTAKSLEMCIADTHQRIFSGSFDLSSLLYTSACRRSHMKHKYRKVYVATSVSDLQSKLKSGLNRQVSPCKSDLKLIFVFCGNGVTYRGMCKQLMKDEPVFREKVREVENYFLNCRGTSIFQKIGDNYDNDDYSKPEVVQPLLFAIQVALVSLLEHWGIRPDVVLGHSVGEVAAAHCSGLLSLQDAVKVIYHRSHLQSKVTGGKMLVVGNIAVSDVMKILPAYTGKVCLAALNSPMSCVLSGNGEAIDSVHQELVSSLQSKNLFLHVLDVPVAYHSHIMDPILDSIEASIGSLVRNELKCELFSTVSGNIYRQGDFTTGKYWAKNIRKPVEFEEALKAAAKDKNNLVFVEIGPRKALQRNIRETLGNDTTVLPSVRPDKDSETMLSVASELFELGVNVNWNHIYKGFEAPPTPIPRYQFDCPKKEVYYEEIRQGNEMQAQSSHSLISQSKHDSKEYKCNLSTDASSYLWDHKNNGRVVIPGALYVELAFASVLASACPKRPLAFLRLSIDFLNILVLTKSSPPLSVLLEPAQDKTNLKILSSTTVHASGTISYENGRGTSEHQMILLDVVWKRCQVVMSSEQVYGLLSQAGFEYGPIFRQLEKVCYGHEFKEAIATVRIPDGLLNQLHEYCLHPVVLDYFLQMTSVVALSANSVRPGFPATIGSVMIFAPLHQDMIMYLRVTKDTSNYFEVCGCFTDTAGLILVELKYVRIRFLRDINTIDSCFFQNELLPITNHVRISCSPRVVVFEDTMGLAKALKSYLHPQSIFISPVELTERSTSLISNLRLQSDQDISDLNSVEILICFGIDNLSHLTTETILEHLVEICDRLREIVLSFKSKGSRAFRVITYRTSARTVDHINPGFVLSGLAKTCAAEMPGISFQLIDLASVSKEDIEALIHVISSSKSSRHLEVIICRGQAHSLAMTRTPIKRVPKSWSPIVDLQCKPFILHTEDPYKMASLTAVASNDSVITVEGKYVEVQLSKICAHSSDYYPVSVTDLKFGQTIYWNKDTAQSHKVLALDFCGSVTSVGKDVSKLKVGDHIASCYPIAASSKVVIPEDVCFRTKKLPILQEVPCVSYITLAWEILRCALPRAKHQQKMCIFSAAPDSGLLKVLMFTASKSGWQVHTEAEFNGSLENACHCPVFVLLPPYNQCKVARVSSVCTTTKLIVVICNSHESLFPTSSILQQNNENVCVHILKVTNIFQRSYLKEQGPHICRWVKMMNLNVMSLSLQGTTFQLRSQTENMAFQPEEPSESYFSAKTISLIMMDNGVPNGKTSNIHLLTKPKQLFTKCGVYIVAGGLSGLGFETLKFIAQRGGGGIVTLSRSAISKERQLEMSNIQRGYGVTVVNLQCDISVSEQVMDAITTIEETFPSCTIKGVFHSAAVLHDGLIETLDRSLFEKVLRPKVSGALNLHFATMSRKVDYFVCYSSISSFIGNASQANYAAANSFLDIFCHYRRNLGLAGQSINWGPLNIGLLFKKDHFQRFLEAKGLMIMEVPEIHEALEHCLMINNPQQVVCKFNISNLRNHVLSQNASLKLRLATLIENEPQNTDLTVSQTEVHSSVHEYVRDLLIDIGNIDTEELRDNTTFSALGIDSLSAMTMQNRIFQERGVNIPLVNLLDPNNTHSTLVTILEQTTIEQNQRTET